MSKGLQVGGLSANLCLELLCSALGYRFVARIFDSPFFTLDAMFLECFVSLKYLESRSGIDSNHGKGALHSKHLSS